MKIIADTHTHTLASDHAYSTISENAKAAQEMGLEYLCCTEHSHSIPGSPTFLHFSNLKIIPRYLNDVMIVRGVEVNIIDFDGRLDLHSSILRDLEWVIASYHRPCIDPGSRQDHTSGWLAVAENPLVDVIGHCGDSRYDFDHKTAIKAFKKYGKIVELNNHSFSARPGTEENCPEIARLCAKYGVPVVLSSDAHFYNGVGKVSQVVEMLQEIGFPEELVLNADRERFSKTLHQINGGKITGER